MSYQCFWTASPQNETVQPNIGYNSCHDPKRVQSQLWHLQKGSIVDPPKGPCIEVGSGATFGLMQEHPRMFRDGPFETCLCQGSLVTDSVQHKVPPLLIGRAYCASKLLCVLHFFRSLHFQAGAAKARFVHCSLTLALELQKCTSLLLSSCSCKSVFVCSACTERLRLSRKCT